MLGVRRILSPMVVFAVSIAATPVLAQSGLPPDSAIQALMEARVKLLPSSGMVVGLLDVRGSRVLSEGTVNGEGTPAPDGRTIFEIGSVTKTFTGTLLADMVRRGEVRLDEPVGALLPKEVSVPERGGKRITLLDLATQKSGLPRLPSNLDPANPSDPYADYTKAKLFDFLSGYTLPRDPGAQYEYSNLGMGLLGVALAERAGKDYGSLVHERITGPLGMEDTGIDLTADQRARLAVGHDAGGDSVANWSMGTMKGAGALRSTTNDMLRYVAAALAEGAPSEVAADLDSARVPRREIGAPGTRIGLAWMDRATPAGDTVVWHNGETGGYHAFVGFDPRRGIGVVMLTNNARGADDVALHLLDPSVPITPPPAPRKSVTLTPGQLRAYEGRYELAPGAVLTIRLEDDHLTAQVTGQPAAPIFAESDGHFFYKAVDVTLDFRRNDAGDVVAVVVHQNGRDIEGRRLPDGT